MNYTKGEWKARRASPDHVDIVSGAEIVATVWEERDTTNAQLIAAAPDMYEALKAMYENCNLMPDDTWYRVMAKQALAKAEGKE